MDTISFSLPLNDIKDTEHYLLFVLLIKLIEVSQICDIATSHILLKSLNHELL